MGVLAALAVVLIIGNNPNIITSASKNEINLVLFFTFLPLHNL